MNLEDLTKEIGSKRRTVADLVRFISTRTDHNPNYALLLGAGCSISSGVRSATTLASVWRRELYELLAGSQAKPDADENAQREFLRTAEGGWYDPSKEYSSLFEKRYDLQRQRRMFVEAEVAGKTPSIGYAYLTALVSQNYFNTIFTTNFDDLLNEAFYIYSNQRPIVCAHDSSIHSITVTSKRPKIIKLHGDYLFDDLKSTLRETESLEQNIRAKFTEFAKEYGLIVVGYSGGDRSIMDTITTLLKNEMVLKGGVYWCIRKGAEVPDELRKLVWKDRVYFVEVDGFDELFAEIYSILNKGDVLPSSVISATHKPADVASRLLSNKIAFSVDNKYLAEAQKKLERVSKRTAIANFLAKPDDDTGRVINSGNLGDDDLLLLTGIESCIHQSHYEEAIKKIRLALSDGVKLPMRLRLLRLQVNAHRMNDERKQALAIADELINLQPKRGMHHLLRASLLDNVEHQISCAEEAIEIDAFNVKAHIDRATYLTRSAKDQYGEQRKDKLDKAYESLRRATTLDPRWTNTAWTQLFKTLTIHELDKSKKTQGQQQIIEKMREQNPYSLRVLSLEEQMLKNDDKPTKFDEFFSKLAEGESRGSESLAGRFSLLRIKAFLKKGDLGAAKDLLDQAISNSDYCEESYFCVEVAKILRETFAKDELAIDVLQGSLENDFDGDVFTDLITALCHVNALSKADQLCEKWLHKLTFEWRSRVRQEIFEAKGLYEDALNELKTRARETGVATDEHMIYLYLKLGRFAEADQISRTLLAPINYSSEAVEITINFELTRKRLGKAVDTKRLEGVGRVKPTNEIKAAIAALTGNKSDLFVALRKAMAEDKTFRFRSKPWPIFDEYRGFPEFSDALSIQGTSVYEFSRIL